MHAGSYLSWGSMKDVRILLVLLAFTAARVDQSLGYELSPLVAVAADYDLVYNTAYAMFNILAGPTGINVIAPEKLRKFFDCVDEVTVAALKTDQTGTAFVNEEDLKKNIYSSLLEGDGRQTRELMGKLIGLYKRSAAARTKRDADLVAFFRNIAAKQELVNHGRFVQSVVETYAPSVGTLAFAIDTTGSMSEDIATAKYLAKSITTTNQNVSTSYVLAPFNDPGVPDAQRFQATVDGASAFLSAVSRLRVTYGGDCPELAMRGILNALEVADQFSSIFVFTDATAKDYYLKDQVISEATKKTTSISFFGKQDCRFGDHTIYKEIADALGGHVVQSISKDTSLVDMVKGLTTYSGSDVGGSTSSSGVGKRSTTGKKVVRIPVDTTVTEMTIVVTTSSTSRLSMMVRGPRSKNRADFSISRSYGNLHLKAPRSGYYNLSYSPADSKYTVYFESAFHFRYSFWTEAATSNSVYLLQSPVKGTRAHILVQILHGIDHISTLCSRQIQFLDAQTEAVVSTYSLTETGSRISLTAHVTIPTRSFRIQFVGCDMTGVEVIRQKQLPVTPSNHAVQLGLVGSHTVRSDVVRATFSISNFGKTRGSYFIQVPSLLTGTSASVNPSAVDIAPGTTRQVYVTFGVSSSAMASPEFTVVVTIIGTTEVAAKYTYKYTENARLAAILCTSGTVAIRPGNSSSGYCFVRNLGPGDGRFHFTVSGGPSGFSAIASPTVIKLKENAEEYIQVTASAPLSATTDSAAVFKLIAKSGRLEAGSVDVTFRVQASPCACQNNGTCYKLRTLKSGRVLEGCRCRYGWGGRVCTIPKCYSGCVTPYVCVSPNRCGL